MRAVANFTWLGNNVARFGLMTFADVNKEPWHVQPVELPKGATGEGTPTTLTISIDRDGKTFLDAEAISDAALRTKIKTVHDADPETRAIIAADGRTSHSNVIHVIDLLRRENVTKFAINVDPEEVAQR